MKAVFARLCGSRRIELRDKQLAPKRDEVAVRVGACGICRGDLRMYESEDQVADEWGHEPVGQVVACGARVDSLSEGDWVAGGVHGSFASHFTAPASALYRVPAELGEEGCLAEPLKCVSTVVRAAAPDFGDTVVVVGCGFMGLSAVAALAGAWPGNVIAVESVDARRSLAVELGAGQCLDPSTCDVRAEVLALTRGRGADAAIEFAGTADAPAMAARLLRPRGRLVLAGGQTPGANIYGTAITVHHVPPAFSADESDDYRRAIQAMAAGRFPLSRLISHRFHLSRIQEAFETATASGSDYLKGIVVNDLD